MQFDNSDDEYGFWEPERPRRQRTPRSTSGSPRQSSRPSADEPTRQLRRIDAGRRHGSTSPSVDPSPELVPAMARSVAAAYLDELSELLDHDVAVAMGDDVPVVAISARRSWRARLRRGDGRIDPFVVRVGVVVLVGVVAIPIGAGLSGGSSATRAARPVAAVAPPSSPTPGSAASNEPGADAPITVAITDGAPSAEPVSSVAAAPATTAATTAASVTEEAPTELATTPAAPVTDEATIATATTPDTVVATTGAMPDSAAAAMPDPATAVAPNGESKPEALLAGSSRNSCTSSYTLVAGDYWLGIADRADVKLGALLIANRATSSTPLYPGRSICLPAGATTPLPPASTTTGAPPTIPPTTASPTTAPTTTRAPTTTTSTKKSSATTAPTTTATTTTAPKATSTSKTSTATTTPKTKVAPTTIAAPTTTVMKRTYSRDQVAQIIRDVWPNDLEDKAIAIATRESNLQPQVRNFCCFGLFQIYYSVHQGWLSGIGITSADQLYDPTNNAQAALALYNRNGGWGPWGG